jgi:hypothetical protein
MRLRLPCWLPPSLLKNVAKTLSLQLLRGRRERISTSSEIRDKFVQRSKRYQERSDDEECSFLCYLVTAQMIHRVKFSIKP